MPAEVLYRIIVMMCVAGSAPAEMDGGIDGWMDGEMDGCSGIPVDIPDGAGPRAAK